MCLYQMPGRCPRPITDRFVNTVTAGRVGAPNASAPRSNFMAQWLVLSIDICRGLGISPLRTSIWLSFSQADIGPTPAQERFFSFFFKLWNVFFKICAHSERYRNLMAGIFEIRAFFFGNIAFPLSPVLRTRIPAKSDRKEGSLSLITSTRRSRDIPARIEIHIQKHTDLFRFFSQFIYMSYIHSAYFFCSLCQV